VLSCKKGFSNKMVEKAKMRKYLPFTLILAGTTLVIASVVYWIILNEPSSSQTSLLSTSEWITIIIGALGLGASIKGWIDLLKKEKTTSPTIAIDAKDSNPQFSTGEEGRNIQTQIYIEKQVLQQSLKSKKAVQNSKSETSPLLEMEEIEENIRAGSRIRYLDALDSARFSLQSTEETNLLNTLYVKAQIVLAFISGDSIVVSENQFFDSQGFIDAFNELFQIAKKSGLNSELPIRVAIRKKNNNLFEVIANNLYNDRFVLSLWKHLDNDRDRRILWANAISHRLKPPDDKVRNDEKDLLDKLWRALEYFSPERCIIAKEISSELVNRIKRVMNLSNEDIDDLRTGIRMGVFQRKYFESKAETDSAKEIRDALKTIQGKVGEINSRSLIRRELIGFEDELQEGVIELTDSIYNQTIGIGTRATLIQSSTFPSKVHKYIRAGYSLATYLQDTTYSSPNYTNWEIYSFDYFENLEGLDDSRRKKAIISILNSASQNTPWQELVDIQKRIDWRESLQKYRKSLKKLQDIEKNLSMGSLTSVARSRLENERGRFQRDLKRGWTQLIKIVSKTVANKFWNITPTEIVFSHPDYQFQIHISYSFLKIKLDMEDDKGYQVWRNKLSFKGRLDERIDPTT
jgi:hypothetical protein